MFRARHVQGIGVMAVLGHAHPWTFCARVSTHMGWGVLSFISCLFGLTPVTSWHFPYTCVGGPHAGLHLL